MGHETLPGKHFDPQPISDFPRFADTAGILSRGTTFKQSEDQCKRPSLFEDIPIRWLCATLINKTNCSGRSGYTTAHGKAKDTSTYPHVYAFSRALQRTEQTPLN